MLEFSLSDRVLVTIFKNGLTCFCQTSLYDAQSRVAQLTCLPASLSPSFDASQPFSCSAVLFTYFDGENVFKRRR